jgi:hypothetical protein
MKLHKHPVQRRSFSVEIVGEGMELQEMEDDAILTTAFIQSVFGTFKSLG